MKILIAAIFFCLAYSQSSEVRRQTDREHDGFVGPVKKMHEDWSPVTKNWYDIRPGTRCRKATKIFDPAGRITQSSLYPGSCGADELREYYIYFDSDDKAREAYLYSDYELNSQGDWIKRKESIKNSDGVVRIAFNYRKIEYYQK